MSGAGGKKNCLSIKGGLNEKFKNARTKENRRASRALDKGLDHPGTTLINSIHSLATECHLPQKKRVVLLDNAKALVVAGLTHAGSEREAFARGSCTAKGCEITCVYEHLHDPATHGAVPCAKCTAGDKSHKPHDRPACPMLNNHDPTVSQFLLALDDAVGKGIGMSASFQAAVSLEEARLQVDAKAARTASRVRPKAKSGSAKQATLSFVKAINTAQARPAAPSTEGAAELAIINALVDAKAAEMKLEAKAERQAAAAPVYKHIPSKVKLAERCQTWMFDGVDVAIEDHETNNSSQVLYRATPEAAPWRMTGDGVQLPPKPDPNARLRNCKVVCVDFDTPAAKQQMQSHGMAHVPCKVPGCTAATYQPAASKRWTASTSAPTVVSGPDGVVFAATSKMGQCPNHGLFAHMNPVTFQTMPVETTAEYPFEATDVRKTFMPTREFSGVINWAVKHQTGFNTIATAVAARAADVHALHHLEYVSRARVWWNALSAVAGDDAWANLDNDTRSRRVETRAEHVVARSRMRGGEAAVLEFDTSIWTPSASSLQDVFLEAAEFRRSIRGAYTRGVGASSWVGIDHTKTTGEKFGKEWLATLTNEIGQLMSVLAVDNTKASELLAWCASIKMRASFVAGGKGSVLVVDNVPTNFVKEDAADQYKSLVCEALGLEATIQDLFHVMSNSTAHANNNSSQYFKVLILGLRNAIRVPVQKHLDDLKRALLSGGIQFAGGPRSWQKEKWSIPAKGLSEEEFARWQSTGALHHFFTKELCLVPHEHRTAPGMDAEFAKLKAKLEAECFALDEAPTSLSPRWRPAARASCSRRTRAWSRSWRTAAPGQSLRFLQRGLHHTESPSKAAIRPSSMVFPCFGRSTTPGATNLRT